MRRHTDEPGRALLADLDRRAARVGVPRGPGRWTHGPGRAWPYGPNVYIDMRPRMVAWAELRGLTYAPRVCTCPRWLRTGRCPGGHDGRPVWADHITAWKRDGQPALLLAHPYAIDEDDIADLVELAGDSRLYVDLAGANGWYGGGTRPVAVWLRPGTAPIARPPTADRWCLHHGRPDRANHCPNPGHPDGCAWGGTVHTVNRCEECTRLATKGSHRRPLVARWPTGHDASDCLHCEVCDVCKGSGRVCRWCGRCDEHELSYQPCLTTDHCGRCDFCMTTGARLCEACPACDERGRVAVAECARTRPSTFTRRDPVTGYRHRHELVYFEHSTYDKVTGRWSE